MRIDVRFAENEQSFATSFGQVQTASDGGFERGYAKGYEVGSTEGYSKGHADGLEKGYSDGVASVPDFLSLRLKNELVEYSNNEIKSAIANAFRGCTKLKTVNMPNLEEVAGEMFRDCSSLESLNAPYIRSIGAYAFYTCNQLTELVIRSDSVCDLSSTTGLANSAIARGTGYVYVPDNLVERYKAAPNWSTYAAQIKPLSEYEE